MKKAAPAKRTGKTAKASPPTARAKAPSHPPTKKTTATRKKPSPKPPPPEPKPAGRPSKLTDEVQKVIVEAVERGNFYSAAAERAGIDYSTFKRWMEKGQQDGAEFDRYRAFRAAILVANAECQDVQLSRINTAASTGTWQAAAWILERRFPEEWGRKDKVQHEGADAFAMFLDEVARKRAEQVAATSGTSGTGDAA